MATIDQLSQEAQQTALENFIAFYTAHYHADGMDVLSQLDQSGHVADINQYLLDNRSLTAEDVKNGLLTQRRGNLIGLIQALNISFNANGIPDTPWETWLQNIVADLPQGL
ncbi:hypothetical protein [Lacticaseibacillus saniviri]|nr:hypothetical protein [Lacticaseibacillus saniviri]MCG4281202.1 hypothetical protein [Lacticaseibacillus saniviri]